MALNKFNEFLVVIPAYNEAKSIGLVVELLQKSGLKHIVVVDDGSKDETGKIAKEAGAKVVVHKANQGMGEAVRTGLRYAVDHSRYKYVVTADADGQHRTEDIIRVALKIKEGGDKIYGQRNFNGPGVPKASAIYNYIADIIVFFFSGKYLKDVLTGLRCLRIDKLKLLKLCTKGYAIESEIVIESVRNHLKIVPVPIEAVYSAYSSKKVKRLRLGGAVKLIKELLLRESKNCY